MEHSLEIELSAVTELTSKKAITSEKRILAIDSASVRLLMPEVLFELSRNTHAEFILGC